MFRNLPVLPVFLWRIGQYSMHPDLVIPSFWVSDNVTNICFPCAVLAKISCVWNILSALLTGWKPHWLFAVSPGVFANSIASETHVSGILFDCLTPLASSVFCWGITQYHASEPFPASFELQPPPLGSMFSWLVPAPGINASGDTSVIGSFWSLNNLALPFLLQVPSNYPNYLLFDAYSLDRRIFLSLKHPDLDPHDKNFNYMIICLWWK